jgi:hypothetical protein
MSGKTLPMATGAAAMAWHVRLLVSGYPSRWRTRYQAEMEDTVMAMRGSGQWRTRDTFDLARGLLTAWTHPTPVPAPEGYDGRTRASLPASAWGLLLFVLSGAAFAKVIEDPTIVNAAGRHPALALFVDILTGCALATALVMVVAVVPSLVALWRSAEGRRWRTFRPFLVVPVAIAFVAIALTVARAVADGTPVHSARHIGAFTGLAVVTILAAAACTIALLQVGVRVPDGPGVLLGQRSAMVCVAVTTCIATLAVGGWLVAAALRSPGVLRASDGLLATRTLPSVALVLAGLLAAAVLSGRSALRALAD